MTSESGIYDLLTGAYTRAYFAGRFFEERERARRCSAPLSLCVLDIDSFKGINEAYGPSRGDGVLTELTVRIHRTVRSYDLLFRYSGDEFVLLLPHSSKAQALQVAERIMKRVTEIIFEGVPPLNISLSMGVASYPEDVSESDQLFEKADLRLLEAKHLGRGRCVSEDMIQGIGIPLDGALQIIDREHAFNRVMTFLGELNSQRRGVLRISGLEGSGRSRFIREVAQAARVRGYEVLFIKGSESLRSRPYAALMESKKEWKDYLSGRYSASEYCEALEVYFAKSKSRTCIIAVDDWNFLDRATLDLIHQMVLTVTVPSLALIYTIDCNGGDTMRQIEAPLSETIELEPVSREGLRMWLRSLLSWEPPAPFHKWLYRETGGMPEYVRRALNYLIKRGILERDLSSGWIFTRDYKHIHLGERAGIILKEPPHNLPVRLTEFIGRHSEVQDLIRKLNLHNLVTLTGPGGAGKTRLAVHAARSLLKSYPDGIFFVALAAVTSKKFIISAIADAVGITFYNHESSSRQLMDYLREKEILLIFDSMDHLTDGAVLIEHLLAQCGGIHIIVTTEKPLNLIGEMVVETTGLEFPNENSTRVWEDYSAVQLFIQAARRVDFSFEINFQNRKDILEICQLLEGMPLGLELAATWVRVMSCREIALEIRQTQENQKEIHSGLSKQQRSIRAAFEHSWSLLTAEERKVFGLMTVFRGGFDKEAAHYVTGASLSLITTLMDKSLVYRHSSGRFTILEVLRQLGEEKLLSLETETTIESIRNRYAEYFGQFLEGMMHSEWSFKDLHKEIKNLREGWLRAVFNGDLGLMGKYIEPLASYYQGCGIYEEAGKLFGAGVTRGWDQNSDIHPTLRTIYAQICFHYGTFCLYQKRIQNAETAYQSALSIFDETENTLAKARVLDAMGSLENLRGDINQAKLYYEQGLDIQRHYNDQEGIARSLGHLAQLNMQLGDKQETRELLVESLRAYRAVGNQRGVSDILYLLGILALKEKHIEMAINQFQESLSIRKKMQDNPGIADCLEMLADIDITMNNPKSARQFQQMNLNVRREIGGEKQLAHSQLKLAQILLRMDEFQEAQKLLEECLKLFRSLGNQEGKARAMLEMGRLHLELAGDFQDQQVSEDQVKETILETAQSFLSESLVMMIELGLKQEEIEIKIMLGSVAQAQQMTAKAERLFKEALRSSRHCDFENQTKITLVRFASLLAEGDQSRKIQSMEILSSLLAPHSLPVGLKEDIYQVMARLESLLPPEISQTARQKGATLNYSSFADQLSSSQN